MWPGRFCLKPNVAQGIKSVVEPLRVKHEQRSSFRIIKTKS